MDATLLGRALLAVGMAVGGGGIACLRPLTHRQLCALISYAAGALLIVTLFDIIPEATERIGLTAMPLGVVSGYILFALVSRYVAHICPACAATHTEQVFQQVTWLMVVALSIHSVMDGLAVAASWATSGATGAALVGAVFVHKVPEGLALTSVARGAGWSRGRALLLTLFVEGTTTLGGSWLGMGMGASAVWLGWVLAHIGGGFLYLVVHATLSELLHHRPRATGMAVGLGAGTWLLVRWLLRGLVVH